MNREETCVMARRRKPHDPAQATQAALERRDREAERARLEAQGATVNTDRTGHIVSAYRSNVFTLLLQRGTITPNQHDAAYTLANDWAAWKGLDGKSEAFGEVVDGGQGSAELITDRMITAGRRVKWALQEILLEEAVLLVAFMVATVEEDRPMSWRGIVLKATGESVRDRQTELVVAALEALRCVYQEPGRAAA